MAFVGDPITVMLLSVIVATFTLGIANGKSMKAVMEIYADAVKDVAMIVLIVAGAGVLKQVLVDSGVSDAIAAQLKHWPIPPLVLGWLIAAVLRVCIGSATVAGLTTARHRCPYHGAAAGGTQSDGTEYRRRQPHVLPCERCRLLALQRIFQPEHQRHAPLLEPHGNHRSRNGIAGRAAAEPLCIVL